MDLLVTLEEELFGDVMVDGSFGQHHDLVDLKEVRKKASSRVTTLTPGNRIGIFRG